MTQPSPKPATEAAPDDRGSYRRFREIASSLVRSDKSTIPSERSWLARIWESLSPNTAARRRIQADYISLIAPLRQPKNLIYAPAALAGISFLKNDDLDSARRVFYEIQERVIKPSPLFYLMRGALFFALMLLLVVLVFFTVAIGPGGRISINADAARILVGFAAGCMGGFTSIMQRLDHFVSLVDRPRDYLSWTGFALPVVEGTLGLFSSMILLSNLLNIPLGPAEDTRTASIVLYFLFGFIAGYSERFSKSLVKLAEQYFGGRS
jgi:hypothetical protein